MHSASMLSAVLYLTHSTTWLLEAKVPGLWTRQDEGTTRKGDDLVSTFQVLDCVLLVPGQRFLPPGPFVFRQDPRNPV